MIFAVKSGKNILIKVQPDKCGYKVFATLDKSECTIENLLYGFKGKESKVKERLRDKYGVKID